MDQLLQSVTEYNDNNTIKNGGKKKSKTQKKRRNPTKLISTMKRDKKNVENTQNDPQDCKKINHILLFKSQLNISID